MPTSAANPPLSPADPLLRISGLSTGYGKIGVLHGIDLTISTGEVVALLGPNGAGKTTLLRALSGLLPWAGGMQFDGRDLSGAGPRDTAKAGLVHVVEGHRVFTQQTVFENLLLAAYDLPRGERATRVEEALGHFPEIADKRHERAVSLSGGQQQMLAVAQGLVRRPLAGAGRSCVRCGPASTRERHCGAPRRAADREGARARRPRLCARARLGRAGSKEQRAQPTTSAGTGVFRRNFQMTHGPPAAANAYAATSRHALSARRCQPQETYGSLSLGTLRHRQRSAVCVGRQIRNEPARVQPRER